ncbi:MAG TPA: hypothetical protein VH391_06815 [Solirubrobacterales bacterium]|jgi:hypothetical protein
MPALPLDEAGKYVAAAYIVFVALVLVYVAIMAAKLQRIDRELGELADLAEGSPTGAGVEGGVPRARDGVPVGAEVPAATLEPEPADTGREAEDVGGVIPEDVGGVIHEHPGEEVPR